MRLRAFSLQCDGCERSADGGDAGQSGHLHRRELGYHVSTKVADISVTDDALGTNDLSLTGADADKFEIVDNGGSFELHLKAGVTLDHEADGQFDVTVQVDDATVGGTPDATLQLVTDVNEAPTAVSVTDENSIPHPRRRLPTSR